ncbi:hypothetical protein EI94DRAFT_1732471 [Lactarius quietus]|nr:hypothetical protein EI94DRAFT_1732471 [Lactarius quietus]
MRGMVSCRCGILTSASSKRGYGAGGTTPAVEEAVSAGYGSCGFSPVPDDMVDVPSEFGASGTVPDSDGSGIAGIWSCPSHDSFASKRELCCTIAWGGEWGAGSATP